MEKEEKISCLFLLTTVLMWGLQPAVTKILLASYTTMTVVCIRSTLMVAGYLTVMKCLTGSFCFPRKQDLPLLAFLGLLGTPLNNIPQYAGLEYTTAFNCSLMGATVPTLTAILASILVRERLRPIQWCGIAISFAGVVWMLSQGDLSRLTGLHFNKGDLMILFSEVTWALYIIYSRPAMKRMRPLQVTGWSNVLGVVMMYPYAAWTGDVHFSMPDGPLLLAFLYVSLLAGILAMLFWNIGVKHLGPSRAAIFSNLTPVFGLFFANLILNEPFHPYQFISLAAVLAGVYLLIHFPYTCR